MKGDDNIVGMRKEYDFSGGIRGKYADRYREDERPDDLFASERSQDVQAWLAHALVQVQELEAALVAYVSLVWQDSPSTAGRKTATLVGSAGGTNRSRLLRDLQEQAVMGSEAENELDHVLDEWSWLIHRSGYETQTALSDSDKAISLIERLEDLSDRAISLKENVQRLLEHRLEEDGSSKEEVEHKRRNVIARWRAA